jgi:hypothetical protein
MCQEYLESIAEFPLLTARENLLELVEIDHTGWKSFIEAEEIP